MVAGWLVVAMACSGGPEGEAERAAAATGVPVGGVEVEGRLWAVAGPDGGNSRLYEVASEGLRIADERLATSVTGCRDLVIASAGVAEQGFVIDHLMEVGSDGFGPIPELGTPRGSPPALSEDCRLAFKVPSMRLDEPLITVKTWKLGEGQARNLFEGEELRGGIRWRGDKLLVTVGLEVREIVEVSDTGEATPLGIQHAPGEGFWVTRDDWVAIARPLDVAQGSTFQRIGSDEEKLHLPGWVPLAVGPSGAELLMRSDDELGILELPDLNVRSLGEWKHDPIWDAAWIPEADLD